MLRRLTKKTLKWILGSLAVVAALVTILANWEAAMRSLKKILGFF